MRKNNNANKIKKILKSSYGCDNFNDENITDSVYSVQCFSNIINDKRDCDSMSQYLIKQTSCTAASVIIVN